jgi:hypothetical protein
VKKQRLAGVPEALPPAFQPIRLLFCHVLALVNWEYISGGMDAVCYIKCGDKKHCFTNIFTK